MLIISIKADQGYQKNNDRAITVMNNNDTEDDAEKQEIDYEKHVGICNLCLKVMTNGKRT